jgi:uncharacterized membrane protein YfcA
VFNIVLTISAGIAGAVASVTGFGIGSILTPFLALQVGTKLAVAAISIPHFLATALRFWMLKAHVDKKVLISFGIMSAVGGLLGALLHTKFGGPVLTVIFGCLLVFAGFTGVTGFSQKMKFTGPIAWIAGFFSGTFGGLVGNQGGIRAAALLGFDVSKETFIATSTAIGIVVDIARMPVYFVKDSSEILNIWPLVLLTTTGVIVGTFLGMKFLKHIPQSTFRKVVSGIIFLLGAYMLYEGVKSL